MTEYTFIGKDSKDNFCEIMIDVTDNGKILDLYTYRKDIPVLENEETGKEYKLPYKEGSNPLFIHFLRKVYVAKLLIDRFRFIESSDDEDTSKEPLGNFYRMYFNH